MMEVQGLGWMGVRTERFDETVAFFREVLGLEVKASEPAMVGFRFTDGSEAEVFSHDDEDHTFFGPGPTVGFLVDDVEQARSELEAAGIELIGEVQREGPSAWNHFRGPDGNIYEIVSRISGAEA